VFTTATGSTGASFATITDFVTGSDKINVTLADASLNGDLDINVSGFAAVSSFNDGLVSLSLARGDAFYSSADGKLYVDVDGNGTISQGTDYVVSTAAVAAGDVNFSITGGQGANNLTGGAGNDTIEGGVGADSITGGAGADRIIAGADRDVVVITAASDSSTTAFDTIVHFGLDTINAAQDLDTNAEFIANPNGGGDGDATLLDLSATTGGAEDVASAINARAGAMSNVTNTVGASGILTLAGGSAAQVDTLAEWVAEANAAAETAGEVVAFLFNGDTYVFVQGGANGADTLVKLEAVLASALVKATAATTASAGSIIFAGRG